MGGEGLRLGVITVLRCFRRFIRGHLHSGAAVRPPSGLPSSACLHQTNCDLNVTTFEVAESIRNVYLLADFIVRNSLPRTLTNSKQTSTSNSAHTHAYI